MKKPSSQRLIPGTLGSTGVSNTKGNVNFAANSSGFSETAIRQKPTRLAPLKPALTSADASQTLGRAGSPKTLSKSSAKTIQSAAPELLGRLAEYRGEEDAIPCRRFPHKKFCGCDLKCYEVETNPKFKATLVGFPYIRYLRESTLVRSSPPSTSRNYSALESPMSWMCLACSTPRENTTSNTTVLQSMIIMMRISRNSSESPIDSSTR